MKSLPKILLALTAVAAFSLAYPASVQAVPTTYQYTGNPFTDVSGAYTTSMFVTAMVTVTGPLAPNMPFTQVFPTAFTLSDGVQTLTNLNSFSSEFFFATGPTGAITMWTVVVVAPPGGIPAPRSPQPTSHFRRTWHLGAWMLASALIYRLRGYGRLADRCPTRGLPCH